MKGNALLDRLFYKNGRDTLSAVFNSIFLAVFYILVFYFNFRLANPIILVLGIAALAYAFFSLGKEGGLTFFVFFALAMLVLQFYGEYKYSYAFVIIVASVISFFYIKESDEIEGREKRNELREGTLEGELVQQRERLQKIMGAIGANKARIENYKKLNEVAQKLTSALEREEISKIIQSAILGITGKPDIKFSLLVWDDETAMFAPVRHAGSDPEPEHEKGTIRIYRNDPFDDWLVKNKFTLIIKNIEDDFRFKNLRKDWINFKAIVAIPLIENAKVIGILKFYSDKPGVFGSDDARMLNYLGDLCTAAVQNSILYQKTKDLATRDGLTGLFIRRHFIQRLDEEMKRAKELNSPLSYVMIDIDHFKDCNDTYGHPFGDKVLKMLGEFLRDNLRDVDIIGRYGGEEFAIILPDTNQNGARFVANRLREDFSKLVISVNEKEAIKLTLSAGGIEYTKGLKLMEVINLADKALYHSKENGRNKVTFWEDISE